MQGRCLNEQHPSAFHPRRWGNSSGGTEKTRTTLYVHDGSTPVVVTELSSNILGPGDNRGWCGGTGRRQAVHTVVARRSKWSFGNAIDTCRSGTSRTSARPALAARESVLQSTSCPSRRKYPWPGRRLQVYQGRKFASCASTIRRPVVCFFV